MKVVCILLSLILFSCSENHFHDGTYKTSVFNGNFSWVHEEQIEIRGSTMRVIEKSVFDSSNQVEYKTSCTQFEDRVEFKDRNGIVVVARFDDQGNLKYGDYTYKSIVRVGNEKTGKPDLEAEKSLLKKGDDDKLTFVSSNATSKNPTEDDLKRIKTYSDDEIAYDYVETIKTDEKERFFHGKKSFEGHIDDVYDVKINGDQIVITEPQNADEIVLAGSIKQGKILDKNGQESKFRYKNKLLYYHGMNNEWYVFYEMK